MDAARDEFAAAGCSVLVVTQSKPEFLALYLQRMRWHVPVVCDPGRDAYAAFGLERTRWTTFLKPGVIWGYLRALFHGYGVKKPLAGEDVLQLGGDFILNRQSEIVFAYRSTDPTDRPGVAALLAPLSRASARPINSPPAANVPDLASGGPPAENEIS